MSYFAPAYFGALYLYGDGPTDAEQGAASITRTGRSNKGSSTRAINITPPTQQYTYEDDESVMLILAMLAS